MTPTGTTASQIHEPRPAPDLAILYPPLQSRLVSSRSSVRRFTFSFLENNSALQLSNSLVTDATGHGPHLNPVNSGASAPPRLPRARSKGTQRQPTPAAAAAAVIISSASRLPFWRSRLLLCRLTPAPPLPVTRPSASRKEGRSGQCQGELGPTVALGAFSGVPVVI